MSCSVFSTTLSLMQMFNDKIDEYVEDIKTDHMVWLEEIQQEATCMFSSEFSAEPELMPKTPSQKKSTRRKRVSLGRDASRVKRRFSKGKRSNLRRFSVTSSLNLIPEDAPKSPASEVFAEEPKRNTRRNKQVQSEEDARPPLRSGRKAAQNSVPDGKEPESAPSAPSTSHTPPQIQILYLVKISAGERESAEMWVSRSPPQTSSTSHPPPPIPMLEAAVRISASERQSAEKLMATSPGCTATKITIAGSAARSSRRSSVRHSLTVRHSLVGLRHSMTQESLRRASRRSFLKMKARMGSSTCSSNVSDVVVVSDEEEEVEEEKAEGLSEQPAGAEVQTDMGNTEALPDVEQEKSPVVRLTRSRAQNTPVMTATASIINKDKCGTPDSGSDGSGKKLQSNSTSSLRTRPTAKRKAADATEDFLSPRKKASPPKKSQTAIRPAMRSFLHTVQKNQLLMMTPSSTGRTNVMKSFIKHTTPLRVDIKSGSGVVERERLKLEALKKKQEQEEERKRKMETEKKRKQEELKRKRDERLRKVVEARIKEEQRDEEKKKKIEQKMAQIDEKNDKLRVERLAEEKAKKVASTKRQEELEQRRKLEEEARRNKIQQAEEEKRLQEEQQAKRRVEEEQERVRRLAEARCALELKKEQEREIERERQAAAEREREEREKALALQREVEKALRDKERRELDEWRKREEEQQKRVEEERAARLREVKQKEAAAALAAAQSAPSVDQHSLKKAPGFNITVDIESSLMKTPVGKGPGFNATIDIEQSPQSYDLTPKGGNKPVVSSNLEDYGMDQNSDDSTDDEQAPRKPIPSWAVGVNLKQSIEQQYFNPLDLHAHFGDCEPPQLESIFFKSKPRYFKRTSSAVWHSPPLKGTLPF